MFKQFFKCYSLVAVAFWLFTLLILQSHLIVFYMVLVAFLLGLRHGFDADHIVAIDNVTRKFAVEKKYYLSTGTYFALGHSSIVVIMTVLLIFGISIFKEQSSIVMTSGMYIGALTSIIFLWLMAFINCIFIMKLLKRDQVNLNTSFISKLTKPLLVSINKPYKMYFVGFIFGLGFDTATEIGLLGLAASSYINGISISFILLLPLAFALGMAFVDSLSAGLMAKLVSIANENKQYYKKYQLIISSFALVISVLLGLFELFSLFDIQVGYILNQTIILVSNYSEIIGGSIVGLILIFFIYYFLRNRYAGILNLK
ncbi:metal transporter [Thiotrichales bacterium 19S3-7]|nr:metal transporter [Thiotrichales bacterium 19S3-7]MCF6802057.1 metal transporter [Thiotrichales bacterium 19S3-11]